MRDVAYHRISERQAIYWWHRARRELATALIRKWSVGPVARCIDLGCGPGGNAPVFEPFAPELNVGFDLSPLALQLARSVRPEAPLVQGDLSRPLPFADSSFDAATIFNVLYHSWVVDHTQVLAEAGRILRPGGLLVLTEPAFDILRRGVDEVGMGVRRFRLSDIEESAGQAGLEVVQVGYFTSFGFPLALLLHLMSGLSSRRPEIKAEADMKPLPTWFNGLMLAAARLENRLVLKGIKLPFGVTIVGVLRRPMHP